MTWMLAFFCGTLTLLALPMLPAAWLVFAVAGVMFVALISRHRFVPTLALCGFGAGFLYAAAHAYFYMEQRWPTSRMDDRVIAHVIIATVPASREGAWTFDGDVTPEAPHRLAAPLRVRIVWRNAEQRPHAGEQWRLLLSLRPPRARVNPGGTDVERMLFHDRIHALGSVVDSSINRRIGAGTHPLEALRERIAHDIDDRVADREAAALIAALAVGVTGEMSSEQWRIFNATGTTHLVAISGLHVTLFALIAITAARWLWSIAFWRVMRTPRETFAAVVGFAAATAYACLAGLSVPTQRTLIMLGVWLLTRSLARASPPFHSFALALVAVLLVDPFAPLAPGFWLSFAAMGTIILVTAAPCLPRLALVEAAVVQGAVTVALAPLTLAAFGSLSLIGPVVNAVAIPAMSWVFVPTILLAVVLTPAFPSAGAATLAVAEWMHHAGWPWLVAAADLPWALIHASPPGWWYVAASLSVGVALMPLPRALRLAAILGLVPLALAGSSAPTRGNAEITVLDAGEGTAIVVRTASHVLVYGTGDVYGTDGRIAEAVLLPFLRSQGAPTIDLLIATGTRAARSGLTAVLAAMPIRETLVDPTTPADFDGARECTARQWMWDQVAFQVRRTDGSVSAGSCVLLVETHGSRVLMAAEVDASTETGLVAAGMIPPVDIVVVPRHGSDAASTPRFIRAVGARWAVVAGRRAKEGRTKPAIARWEQNGAEVVATADLGAIRFTLGLDRGAASPRGERAAQRRLWRLP